MSLLGSYEVAVGSATTLRVRMSGAGTERLSPVITLQRPLAQIASNAWSVVGIAEGTLNGAGLPTYKVTVLASAVPAGASLYWTTFAAVGDRTLGAGLEPMALLRSEGENRVYELVSLSGYGWWPNVFAAGSSPTIYIGAYIDAGGAADIGPISGSGKSATIPDVPQPPVLDFVGVQSAHVGDAAITVQMTGQNLSGASWAVTGHASASVDSAGLVTITTGSALSATLTVTATTDDGEASRSFGVEITAAGDPPTAVGSIPTLVVIEDVPIASVDLRPYWSGADSYSAASLPTGLAITGYLLAGTPTNPAQDGTYTINGTNANGSTPQTISIVIGAAPTAPYATVEDLFAASAAASPGDQLAVAQSLTSAADLSLSGLSALTGDTNLTLIGCTDFRAGTPTNVDYDPYTATPFTDAEGDPQTTVAPSRDAHPMFGYGQWYDGADVSTPLPIDHVGGVPMGLVLGTTVERRGANAIGHNSLAHDGHIIWLAEYEMEDGSTLVTWDELENTRGANPRLPVRAPIIAAGKYLRRFATFQRASHASLKTMEIWETQDCRRWVTPARRERHSYGSPSVLGSVAAVETAIASLPTTATTHVLGLAGVNLGYFALGSAARDKLLAIRNAGGRVFLVGTPGQTIIRSSNLSGHWGLDFGWVTFCRDAIATAEINTPVIWSSGNCEVGFYGCVIDGLDCASKMFDGQSFSAQFTLADSVVIARNGPSSASSVSSANMPRFRVARCIMDIANDLAAIYGAGSIRIESSYMIGSGGVWQDGGYLHADIGGQYQGNTMPQQHWIALWDNIWDMGPNAFSPDAVRAEPNTFMNQSGQRRCVDIVGNIFIQPVLGQGWQRTGWARRPANGESLSSSWWNGVHLAHNMWLMRPDTVQSGWSYPLADIGTMSLADNAAFDLYVATGNLMMRLPRGVNFSKEPVQAGFSRTISLFPEEITADLRDIEASTALASFPAVSGTWAGGYTLDWSGTTYAGTSREGFIAPEDCVVSADLLSWGASPLRGLPHDADYIAANFTGLPADIRVHLGYVDDEGAALACGYGADWFGGYAPTAGTIDATIADPWGASDPDHAVVVNCKIGTLGTGTIIEEVDAGDADKVWRLDVVQEGSAYFPRFTLTDAAGAVTHQVQSARPLTAGAHLLMTTSVHFRPLRIEGFMLRYLVSPMVFDHYQRDGETDELSAVFETAATAPTIPSATTGSREVFIWCDTSAATNLIRWWTGSAWATPPEAWRTLASSLFLEEHRLLASDKRDRLYGAPFGAMKFRYTFVETWTGSTVHTPAGSGAGNYWGDRVWSVQDGTAYSTGPLWRRWNGSAWVELKFGTDADIQPEGGDVPVSFVIDGAPPVRRVTIGKWANTAGANGADGLTGTSGTLARGTVYVGDAAASPYSGTLAVVEARRLARTEPSGVRVGPFDGGIGSVQRLFRRAPVNAATGARDNILLPAAPVWELAS